MNKSIAFYNNLYSNGYLDEWPIDKTKRIFEIIETLGLPERGDVLDFGCGNGVFTELLKRALPKWNVYGVDISVVAIGNAQRRYPGCTFLLLSEINLINKKFDFLFSHHTLEHVADIDNAWNEIDQFLKKESWVLHVLPCGNKGSFEYNICLQVKDGIDRNLQGRFYFEDKSHLRRLTTEKMNDLAKQYNFILKNDFYGNHFWGALDWITLASPSVILDITDLKKAKDKISVSILLYLCVIFGAIKFIRFPANMIDYKKNKMKKYEYFIFSLLLLIYYPISKLVNIFLKYMSRYEWRYLKSKKNGSEMYLHYYRRV